MSLDRETRQQQSELIALVRDANEEIESAGQGSASHAFNLGCSMIVVPGMIGVVAAFLLSEGNWVLTAIVLAMVALAGLGFANLAAYRAKTHTMDRVYQEQIEPKIIRFLREFDLTRPEFDRQAAAILPNDAALTSFLTAPPQVEDEGPQA